MRLNTLVESGARRFTYLYDFGDVWEHMVKNEDLVMPAAEGMKIRCLAGENACPPEDVGGPHSYFDFLMAIKDPLTKNTPACCSGSAGPVIQLR